MRKNNNTSKNSAPFGTILDCGCQHHPIEGFSKSCLGRLLVGKSEEEMSPAEIKLRDEHNHSSVVRWFGTSPSLTASIGQQIKASTYKMSLVGM